MLTYRSLQQAAQLSRHISTRLQTRFIHKQLRLSRCRRLHKSSILRDKSFTNILADETPPPVQVKSVSEEGITLSNGLLISSPCIFTEGKVFLWDTPSELWKAWTKDVFEVFETIIPRPEILLLGTGATLWQLPSHLRVYLNELGIQVDIMDTRNACATYNILSEEGRRVAVALLPISRKPWKKVVTS